MNVLLVDDSASVRAILQVYLMGLHPTFLEAEDGERALRVLRLSPVDLVIVDVQMSPMDGITFVRELRQSERPQLRSVPVVMLTSDRSEAVRVQGLEAGANAFVCKPVDARTLLQTIQDVMPRGSP
ncbi:response regulator [Anaeromyxobacter oryzae]|uniref:Response regulator n=1 Tax=Anaeromyxobacter oryzae TaxID=2918170 RepID=A0ABN6MS64_9BACT|nr:response regulator [Anaeromyxobacter oryzae]BDG02752.1 response regulator [Anaeromyxobacter oryzae]